MVEVVAHGSDQQSEGLEAGDWSWLELWLELVRVSPGHHAGLQQPRAAEDEVGEVGDREAVTPVVVRGRPGHSGQIIILN